MHGTPVVSIVVISYNTREMTLASLRSVFAETTVPFELIVVDNASTDGSPEAIAAEFPNVLLIKEGVNHGFAAANNLAMQAGIRGDLLLLLNPDTVILDGAIDRLVEFSRQRPTARIWGGRTLNADHSLNPTSCSRQMTLWNVFCRTTGLDRAFRNSSVFNSAAYGGWKRDSERDVDTVSGCFLLIERELWTDLGGFDPNYVMYGEEVDLCQRARSRGASPRFTETAEIIHYGGASETVRSAKHVRLLKAKITTANRHLPAWQRPLAVALLRMWPLSRWLASAAILRLQPTPDHRKTYHEWATVWSQRSSWWGGYAPSTHADRPSIIA